MSVRSLLRDGHSTSRVENGTVFKIVCQCGWSTHGLIGAPDNAEQLAYEHIMREPSDTSNQGRLKAAGLWLP